MMKLIFDILEIILMAKKITYAQNVEGTYMMIILKIEYFMHQYHIHIVNLCLMVRCIKTVYTKIENPLFYYKF